MNKKDYSPVRLLLYTAVSIFTVEFCIMLFLEKILSPMPFLLEAFVDSFVLIIVVYPAFYWFMFRPLSREISEHKQVEDGLRSAMIQAESANRAKSEFLANVSHELRTPLNAIIGFSELLLNDMAGPLTDKQKDFLKDVFNGGRSLLATINDIIEVARIDSGRLKFEQGEFDVGVLIKASIAMVEEGALKHNIKVDGEVEEGIGNIVGDEGKIKQVLLNLLDNAVKFTPDGGSVRVSAKRVNSEQLLVNSKKLFTNDYSLTTDRDFIEISVSDTGIGIDEKDMSRLFQPFQQLEPALTKRYAGVGLGLNLSKNLVELCGGRIWAESEPGRGSRFSFVIPVKKMTVDA